MTIRNDDSVNIDLYGIDRYTDKADVRDFLLETMKSEENETKYRYFVESLSNGNRIYLERPGRLNKGCDFVIYIENTLLYKNNNDKPPKHNFILDDLREKRRMLSKSHWELVLAAIKSIYELNSYNDAIKITDGLPTIGYDFELILKLLRWLFIEQDITYWAKSGRKMLFHVINGL